MLYIEAGCDNQKLLKATITKRKRKHGNRFRCPSGIHIRRVNPHILAHYRSLAARSPFKVNVGQCPTYKFINSHACEPWRTIACVSDWAYAQRLIHLSESENVGNNGCFSNVGSDGRKTKFYRRREDSLGENRLR